MKRSREEALRWLEQAEYDLKAVRVISSGAFTLIPVSCVNNRLRRQ